MNPLTELAQGPNPILDSDQVEHLFGLITQVLRHHELFYMALTTRTMAWTATEKIGDIFLSSFNLKEVIKHYSLYVNNFTMAMQILEKRSQNLSHSSNESITRARPVSVCRASANPEVPPVHPLPADKIVSLTCSLVFFRRTYSGLPTLYILTKSTYKWQFEG